MTLAARAEAGLLIDMNGEPFLLRHFKSMFLRLTPGFCASLPTLPVVAESPFYQDQSASYGACVARNLPHGATFPPASRHGGRRTIFAAYARNPDITRFLIWRPDRTRRDFEAYIRACLDTSPHRARTYVMQGRKDSVIQVASTYAKPSGIAWNSATYSRQPGGARA